MRARRAGVVVEVKAPPDAALGAGEVQAPHHVGGGGSGDITGAAGARADRAGRVFAAAAAHQRHGGEQCGGAHGSGLEGGQAVFGEGFLEPGIDGRE